ncbi:Cilia-and flagella-associated protein 46 [Ceratobasidium sp. AG-Ba]|nr:Cilia-and flagella-associated protein 46 [Ceratobasidium sp. AG-Ba]
MSRFKPTRTSSPLVRTRAQTVSVSTPAPGRPSNVSDDIPPSALEILRKLTQSDIQLIDAIIERAPNTAKNFVAVYKAYNAELEERGLVPSDDIIYYNVLLKLQLVKGAEWGEKWATAKAHLRVGGGVDTSDLARAPSPSPPFVPAAPLSSLKTPGFSSQAAPTPRYRARFVDDAPSASNPSETAEPSHASANLQRLLRKLTTTDNSSTTGRTETSSIATPSSRISNLAAGPPIGNKGKEVATPRPTRPPVRIAASLDESTPFRRPLEYRSRFTTPSTPAPLRGKVVAPIAQIKREEPVEPIIYSPTGVTARRNVVGDTDTWRLIKLEKDADYFRRDKLLDKFFRLWKQNVDWIRDTNIQVREARHALALRRHFIRWQDGFRAHLDMTRRAARVDAHFTQRRAFVHWRQVIAHRRRQQWQVDMKRKLRTIRLMVDKRVLRHCLERWRGSTQALARAEGFYDATILHRCIALWTQRLQTVRLLPMRALEFRAARHKALLGDLFDLWKSRAEMRVMERIIATKRNERIKNEYFVRWRKDTHSHHALRNIRDRQVLRSMFAVWRTKTKRVRTLERRGNDYLRRQNRILLQAVHRVWAAKARGEQLMRINRVQLLRDALSVWRGRVIEVRSLEVKASALINHADKELLVRAFYVIRSRIQAIRSDDALATQHYQRQLLLSAFATWREAAALRRKQVRQARIARRFFVERSTFGVWKAALVQKRLTGLEAQLKHQRLRSVFQVWKDRFKRNLMLKRMGDVVQGMVEQRVMYSALRTWIGAVVDNKLQLLQAVEERNSKLQRLAFEKWKEMKARKQEEMSLLQSFQDVKRDDMVRRAFQKWVGAWRHTQRRRESLERKEQQIRLYALERAWDIWRDKFKEENLRVVEKLVREQAARSLLFSTFRALPALRFYATNIRRNAFEKWRASLPSAKLARVAREFERGIALRKMLAHWRERYQIRMGLKAVARARYLRLPPAISAPRPSVLGSAAASRTGHLSRPVFPSAATTPMPVRAPRATGVSLLGRKAVSERAASVAPETRAPSPSTTAARPRSRSPVKSASTPNPGPVTTTPIPTPQTRASLLSGFRVTPRPARTGPFASGPSTITSMRDETPGPASGDREQSPMPLSGTPLSERPSRVVGRRFAR